MRRTIAIYAALLAGGAFLLDWIEYKYVTHAFPTEFYVVLIAAAFAALGVWVGGRLARKTAPAPFERNAAAIGALGLTDRECAVLDLLAAGQSNKEIARSMRISPNTVKTHLAHVFQKLEVQRRTQAIQKARQLALIP
jgi:DNA-binding CsgD family transcriptional regulator